MSEDSKDGVIPHHLGIIMDGNERWAQARGLPRGAGHQAGAQVVRRTVEACGELGIRVLTLYTFSTENWQRPQAEVASLMRLAEEHATRELPEASAQRHLLAPHGPVGGPARHALVCAGPGCPADTE